MAYPNYTASVIVLSQTSGSSAGGQFPFVEKQISGSNLVLQTDASGNAVGSSTITSVTITNLTSSNISASGAITASGIATSTLSASGAVTASTLNAGTTVLGTTTVTSLSSSGTITSSGHSVTSLSSSGAITASNIFASGTVYGTFSGTITSASYVTASTSVIGNLTSSNISASGAITASTLYVVSDSVFAGNLTILGTSSIINISSSNINIGDNRITLNSFSSGSTFPQRYAGIDVFDSGSSYAVTSSILWDSQNNYWFLQTNNSGSPVTSASAIILQGPTGSFGSEVQLVANTFLKAQNTTGNLTGSGLTEAGTTLTYNGSITSSNQNVSGLITVTTASVTALTIITGSSPGTGSQVPATPSSSGMPGQIEVDNNFIYVYTNSVWKRAPLSTWTN